VGLQVKRGKKMGRNLWEESPGSEEFVNSVTKNIDNYKLFPEEHFIKIYRGILSTSEMDSQGEAMTEEALKHTIAQIDAGVMWLGAEHNPKIQTTGRIISAKLFYAARSQIYFIGAVIGYYDPQEARPFKKYGVDIERLEFRKFESLNDRFSSDKIQVAYNPFEIDRSIIQRIMNDAPEEVNKKTLRIIRKALDPITALTILVSLKIILGPFIKEYFGTLGRRSAEATIDFLKWIKRTVLKELFVTPDPKTILTFEVDYDNCRVIFVLDKDDQNIMEKAVDSLPQGMASALALVDGMRKELMKKVVFEYRSDINKWLPLHAITVKVGIIAEKPVTIDPELYRGLSIGAQAPEDDEDT
jgi:hypothetical protein